MFTASLVVRSAEAITVCDAANEPITAPASAVNFTIFLDLVLPFACPSSETAVHVWVAWFQITLNTLFI